MSNRSDRGVVSVLVAVSLVLLVPVLAITVDLGRIRMERTQAQGVADNAVLAAAYASCTGDSDATAGSAGLDVAADNGYDAASLERVSGPANIWRADVATAVEGLFAPAISNVEALHTTTEAGAECRTSASVLPAMFAGDPACNDKTFEWSGSGNNVTGDVHSNDDLKVGGENNVLGYGTYVGTPTDLYKVDWDPSTANPVHEATPRPWPRTRAIADWAPGGSQATTDYVSTTQQITSSWLRTNPAAAPAAQKYLVGNALQSKVYFTSNASGVDLSDSGMTGTTTFVASAGVINVSGSSMNLTAKRDDLLFFGNKADTCDHEAVSLGGSNSTFRGTIYAPRARVKLEGSNHTMTGSVLARTIYMGGSGWTLTAAGAGAATAPATLLLD